MTVLGLPDPVRRMIDATNAGDHEEVVAGFATDATLVDFGRAFTGRAEIARWDAAENTGTANTITVTDVTAEGDVIHVRVAVKGHGYNGPGTLSFTADADHITRLDITG